MRSATRTGRAAMRLGDEADVNATAVTAVTASAESKTAGCPSMLMMVAKLVKVHLSLPFNVTINAPAAPLRKIGCSIECPRLWKIPSQMRSAQVLLGC